MSNRNLSNILSSFGIKEELNILLHEMTLDSRKVVEGDLFVAIKGYKLDGRDYINEAITNGAYAVIAESKNKFEENKICFNNGIPIIYLTNLNNKIPIITNKFYQNKNSKVKLIGVTGTNGKTTITHLIAQLAEKIGEISAVMGTIGNGILGQIVSSKNTTLSSIEIQTEISRLLKKNASLIAMEISSHGLAQGRVVSFNFDAAVFSNLSHDHLDFHNNMEKYESAKWLLFSNNKTKKQIINVDDAIGLKWLQKLPNACAVTMKNSIPNNWHGYWLKLINLEHNNNGIIIKFNSSWGYGKLNSKLIGMFNVSNLLLAIATLLMLNYPLKKLITFSSLLSPICGRMEVFKSNGKPIVIIDYAHTPDALKKVLIESRLYCKKQLWCIFGCGGERDYKKRALMGNIAERFADKIILTNDNPRNENSIKIINDIMKGISNPNNILIILNRSKAIKNAILKSSVDDVIIVAGKGHETHQIFGKYKINHSDRLTVIKLLYRR